MFVQRMFVLFLVAAGEARVVTCLLKISFAVMRQAQETAKQSRARDP